MECLAADPAAIAAAAGLLPIAIPSNRGPSLSVGHTIGAAPSEGMDALLHPTTMGGLVVGCSPQQWATVCSRDGLWLPRPQRPPLRHPGCGTGLLPHQQDLQPPLVPGALCPSDPGETIRYRQIIPSTPQKAPLPSESRFFQRDVPMDSPFAPGRPSLRQFAMAADPMAIHSLDGGRDHWMEGLGPRIVLFGERIEQLHWR